jgi:hypothetical protein
MHFGFDHNTVAIILYWALMLPIAAFILHCVAGYVTDDYPTSFRSALFLIFITAAIVFFTFDLGSYLFVLMMRDPQVGVQLPPNFTYWDWLREPLALKWQVMGYVPYIRWVPVLGALIAGSLVQIFIWKVDFKLGAVVFIAQLILTLAAMAALSFVFRFGVLYYEHYFAPELPPAPHLNELSRRVHENKSEPSSLWRRLDGQWESVNSHLQPLYTFLQPVTNHLPRPAQSFLNSGGWVLVLLGAGGLIAFWPKIHRNRKEMVKPRHKRGVHAHPRIQLAMIGDSVSSLGERQATVLGVPGRLRAVVLIPSTAATGKATAPAPVTEFLDAIRPELSQLTASDFPHVESWTDPHALRNPRKIVETRFVFPEPEGQPSAWRVLFGPMQWQGIAANVALAFLTSSTSAQRIFDVKSDKWSEVIGSRDVPKSERD